MSSLLAWPRVLAFFLVCITLFRFSEAAEESLFTSSVTYCNPPETLLIQRFEVSYFPSNTSVSFNVSVSSVEPNVNVTANLLLNVYGMKPLDITLDLCRILKGALCPLPMYNFTGADSITIPPKLGVADRIPSIAFKIPDLEGFAQLTLTEISTGKVKACVQATLSNGWSAHQEAVEWTTGAVALGTFLAAGAFSIFTPEAIVPFRFLELIYIYQSIASSALLNLNYPSVYWAFTLNFAWAMGLISSADSPVQHAINRMRHSTGGQLADISASAAVGFVNRKLSPFNSFTLLSNGAGSVGMRETVKGVVQTVTANSPNVLNAGIPIYANLLGIATANVFMTVFVISLCLLAIAVAIFALGYVVVLLLRRRQYRASKPSEFDYMSFAICWFLRLALAISFPLIVFAFYQWTLRDSWLSIFLSVITFLVISTAFLYPSLRTFQLARKDSPDALYHHPRHLHRFGCLYAQYRRERYWFFAPLFAAGFLRAIFIAFAKGSAPAQLALMVALELGLVLSYFVLSPAKSKGSHVFTTYLAVTRFVCTTLMIAFLQALQVMPIPRVVIGAVIIVIWSTCVLVTIGNIIWNIALGIRSWRRGSHTSSPATSKGSMLEKGLKGTHGSDQPGALDERTVSRGGTSTGSNGIDLGGDSTSIAQISRDRPINPTPEQNIPLDPTILQPYPISPTGTTISTIDPPSMYSKSSGTITVGSLLPSRWSVSPSQPTSPLTSSLGHSSSQGRRNSLASSLMPPPLTPSDGGHGRTGTLSRNTSLKVQQQHQLYEDIQEESEGSPRSQ